MSNINFKIDVLPNLLAIAVFYVSTVVFFSPAIFEDKSLPQHDIAQWKGTATQLLNYRAETGEEGLWTNALFGGMPGYLINVQFPSYLIGHLQQWYSLYLPHPIGLVCAACLSFYIMLLCFGVRPWLAMLGGLSFGFTAFSIVGLMAGHNAKIAAVAFMPLVMGGIHLTFRGKRLWGFLLTAFGLAFHLSPNHLQITYYLLLMVIIYGLAALIHSVRSGRGRWFFKTSLMLVGAALLAVGANFGRLWTVMEYSQYSTRGKSDLVSEKKAASGLDRDYVFQYSNGILEPLVLFIPNFFGGSSQQDLGEDSHLEDALRRHGANAQQIQSHVHSAPTYWGDQPLTAPYYAGAAVVFLFVLGLLTLSWGEKTWLLVVVVLGIVLSWGKNFELFNYFMFDFFPGYGKFRSVTFAIILPVFAMIVLGFLGLEKVFASDWDNRLIRERFFTALGITAGFALLAIVFAGAGKYQGAVDAQLASLPDWYVSALRADRMVLLRTDAFRSLMFVLLFAAVTWLLLSKKMNAVLGFGLLTLFTAIDFIGIDKRFINADTFVRKGRKTEVVPTAADQVILKDKSLDYRVLNLFSPFSDGMTSYHHQSIGGYHGAKLGRYQELITHCLAPEQMQIIAALKNDKREDFGHLGVLDMLNTKYFLAGASSPSVLHNPHANGHAWFVKKVIAVKNANEEIDTLKNMDTKSTAVIDVSKFPISTRTPLDTGSVILTDYRPNYLKYEAKSTLGGLAVFSEIYYPKGWEAKVDGETVDILRANYVLRALNIPKGRHIVEFRFDPASYRIGSLIMWGVNLTLILLLLYALGVTLLKFSSRFAEQ